MIIEGLVSTIIPVFNRADLLSDAVESVLAQTYRPIEILIVDDGSTDDTGQLVEALAAGNPDVVRAFHVPNGGPGAAREVGRRAARGAFIQYLDSDDLLLPNKLQEQLSGLRAHPECGAAYGRTCCVRLGQKPVLTTACKRTGERIGAMFPSFLQSRWWDTSTPLYRRGVTDAAGPWTSLGNEEDWEYDCRIAALGVRLYWCQAFVSVTRMPPNSLSQGGTTNPGKLADRAQAHSLIYKHAHSAGIGREVPEMQHYARELFLLARQCGAAGLCAEARALFHLAREASGDERGRGWDFRLFGALAAAVGWDRAGAVACWVDGFRPPSTPEARSS